MVVGEVRHLGNGDQNFLHVHRQKGVHHLPMSSGDEADDASSNKRPRLDKKSSEERESPGQEEPTAAEDHSAGARQEIPGNEAPGGRQPYSMEYPEAQRYSAGTAEYPEDPMMAGQAGPQRQREIAAGEGQYGFGRGGVPPAAMGGE